MSERPAGPKHDSPGQSAGAKPRSAALGEATITHASALKGLNRVLRPSIQVTTLNPIGIEVRFWSCAHSGLFHSFAPKPRAALRFALGYHVSALQASQT